MGAVKSVRVFAPPIASCGGGGNPWRVATELVFERLRKRFPEVKFEFFEYFSPEFFEAPGVLKGLQEGTLQTPVVLVDNEIVPGRGKISERDIREYLETHV